MRALRASASEVASSTIRRYPAVVGFALICLVALFGPFLVGSPTRLHEVGALHPPSSDFWFGTDQSGMDIFSRVIHAARLNLGVALLSSTMSVVLGVPLGAFAAHRGGWIGTLVLRVSESLQSFPAMLLALAVVAATGPSIPNLVVVIAVVNTPVYVRLTHSATVPLVHADFVQAARVLGISDWTIRRRHLLPNVSPVVLSQFPVNVAWAIQMLAGLSFLGLGVRLPRAEWGAMVRGGSEYLVYGQWWVALFPSLAILVTILTLNLISDEVRS